MKSKATLATLLFLFGILHSAHSAQPLSTAQSIEVRATPCQVWALLVNADKWSEWNPAVQSSKLVKGDGHTVGSKIRFTPVIGDKKSPLPITLTLHEYSKPEKLEYKAGMSGMHITFGFTIEAAKPCSHCRQNNPEPCPCKSEPQTLKVTSYETISGAGSGLFKVFFSQEGLDKEHQTWVQAIKKQLEPTDDREE